MASPTSTYRIQFTPQFQFANAAALVDYLRELGVGAIYCSPILTSIPGSMHGYDWTDPNVIDPQRGGEDQWRQLVEAAHSAGLTLIVDIVPNHMGISRAEVNRRWWDVLGHGQVSQFAGWFDIDWSAGKIALPVLASDDDVTNVTLDQQRGELVYYEHRFPLAPGTWHAGDDVATVLARQNYQLRGWRQAGQVLNYRRFFTVTDLAGLHVEDHDVALATHRRIAALVRDGDVAGLRVDHPDGLAKPGDYLNWLRELCASNNGGDAWLVVEKILEPGERLPQDWPVAGTTGYDAMSLVGQVFVDPGGEAAFTGAFQQLGGPLMAEAVLEGKREVARTAFWPERRRMLALLKPGGQPVEGCPHDLALIEIAAHLPVYRTYLGDGPQADPAALQQAVGAALTAQPGLGAVIEEVVRQLSSPGSELAIRFEQFCSALMGKGAEDRAFYRANRLIGLNEVGGDPQRFGIGLTGFHDEQAWRALHLPEAMTSLSTHDTKRSADVRARLAALSELPQAWLEFWGGFASRTHIPEPTLAWLAAQTLVGTGLIARDRLGDYVVKAAREAGLVTSWDNPSQDAETQLTAAIDAAFDDAELRDTWQRIDALVRLPGRVNALGQQLVQLTMPGVPDVYQGAELWDIALVDPDNRRPVDFAARRAALRTLDQLPGVAYDAVARQRLADNDHASHPTNDDHASHPAYDELACDDLGLSKLLVTTRALQARRAEPQRFSGYRPVQASGSGAEHLIGFERDGIVTLATRLPVRLARCGGWGESFIELPGCWTDLLTGASRSGPTLKVRDVLAKLPVALLRRND